MARSMRRTETRIINSSGQMVASYELWSNKKRTFKGSIFFKEALITLNGNPNELVKFIVENLSELKGGKVTYLKEFGYGNPNSFECMKRDYIEEIIG
mgnify:CR=1 FL=1